MPKRAKPTERPDAIRDAAAITDHVADVMQTMCPAWSIDTLLTHPFKSIVMAAEVAKRSGRMTGETSLRLVRLMRDLESDAPEFVFAVNEVCRTALSSRKRGNLKRDKV